MDFKIAGTKKGITAIQLDIKPAGIPLDIICESLEPARKGRFQILDRMEQEISTPRVTDGGNAPHLGWFWCISFDTCFYDIFLCIHVCTVHFYVYMLCMYLCLYACIYVCLSVCIFVSSCFNNY